MQVYHYAKQIVRRLNKDGFKAYFAGGWVRDYLMGIPSSDIDIATNARPDDIIQRFRKTIPVGINFGVVVVVMGGHRFEISTFRKDEAYSDGRRPCKIAFTSEEEDALRRDFTINGMFFDPIEDKVIDFVDGQSDILRKTIRSIGDPQDRFFEDRLRMIRAVRFACRFGFVIEKKTREAIKVYAKFLLPAVTMERIWQELKKMAEVPAFDLAVAEMHRLGLLQVIFPSLSNVTLGEIKGRVAAFPFFPKNCPAILYVMELFSQAELEEQKKICHYLKVSNKELKIVNFVDNLRKSGSPDRLEDDAALTRSYAHPACYLALQVIAARLETSKRKKFLSLHQHKMEQLKGHIQRVQTNQPLVTSLDLRKEGIEPGKTMGILLEKAYKTAVNENLHEKNLVIDRLKQSPYWPS